MPFFTASKHDVSKLAEGSGSWSYILPQLRTGYPFSREGPAQGQGRGRGLEEGARRVCLSSVLFCLMLFAFY